MEVATSKLTWTVSLLHDVHVYLKHPPALFCDNLSALDLTINPILHGRTKHIELDHHFVCGKVVHCTLVTKYVSAKNQLANIFTKILPKTIFSFLRSKLGLHDCFTLHLTGTIRDKEVKEEQIT